MSRLKWVTECHAETTRGGESAPCGKVAVALAFDAEDGWYDGGWYPVCKGHARGRDMVPLVDVVAEATIDALTRPA